MLRVVGVSAASTGDVIVDEYVPLCFIVDSTIRPDPILWRIGDFRRNMFELKVDRTTGEVFSATLVIADQAVQVEDNWISSHVPIALGVPLVDISTFSETIVDVAIPFRSVRAGSDFVVVLFGDAPPPTKYLKSGRARFLLNDDELSGIGFGPLTQRELEVVGC